MDIVEELRVYRLAFRIACEHLIAETKGDLESTQKEIVEQSRKLAAALRNEVA